MDKKIMDLREWQMMLFKYKAWRTRARITLLTDITPRVYRLSMSHGGCNYELERKLGKCIEALAMCPYTGTMSEMSRLNNIISEHVINEIIVEELIKDVNKLEKHLDSVS